MLTQLGRARCGIVRHRRCPNPRLPRSTPSAYSRRLRGPVTARLRDTLTVEADPAHDAAMRDAEFGMLRHMLVENFDGGMPLP